ncbi:MAG TPA: transporter associated domain-containing protein, partial [Mycobacteriales bacterium]|nr:transporter associated domain-containing protein [Mycobacteriales bacterium]
DLTARAQDPRGAATRVEEIMREPTFVPESKPVDELLREMQARRTHIAIVIDEYDTERPPVEWVDDDTARVTARMAVEDLSDTFGTEVPDLGDVETVGGLLARELGRVPIPGASVSVAGLTLTAESVGGRRNRIDTVLVHRVPAEEPPAPAAGTEQRRPRQPAEQTADG